MAECAVCRKGTAVDNCIDCSRPVCKRHRNREDGEIRCSTCGREKRRESRDAIVARPGEGDPSLVSVTRLPRGNAGKRNR